MTKRSKEILKEFMDRKKYKTSGKCIEAALECLLEQTLLKEGQEFIDFDHDFAKETAKLFFEDKELEL